jgi:hypothetical protein
MTARAKKKLRQLPPPTGTLSRLSVMRTLWLNIQRAAYLGEEDKHALERLASQCFQWVAEIERREREDRDG